MDQRKKIDIEQDTKTFPAAFAAEDFIPVSGLIPELEEPGFHKAMVPPKDMSIHRFAVAANLFEAAVRLLDKYKWPYEPGKKSFSILNHLGPARLLKPGLPPEKEEKLREFLREAGEEADANRIIPHKKEEPVKNVIVCTNDADLNNIDILHQISDNIPKVLQELAKSWIPAGDNIYRKELNPVQSIFPDLHEIMQYIAEELGYGDDVRIVRINETKEWLAKNNLNEQEKEIVHALMPDHSGVGSALYFLGTVIEVSGYNAVKDILIDTLHVDIKQTKSRRLL